MLTSRLFLNLDTAIALPSVTAQLSEQAFSSSSFSCRSSLTNLIEVLIVFLFIRNENVISNVKTIIEKQRHATSLLERLTQSCVEQSGRFPAGDR